MLYELTQWLQQFENAFRLFNYLTFRAILSILTALVFSFVFGPWLIRRLTFHQIGQVIRQEGPQTHLAKAGTPTMGGAMILAAVTIATLCWADLSNRFVWFALLVTLAFGVVGFVDDYKKIRYGSSKGLSARDKYFWLSLAGFTTAILIYATAQSPIETQLIVPLFKDVRGCTWSSSARATR
jgi:phospho-N-acetylmuramoyl-pentapeptide-transferase